MTTVLHNVRVFDGEGFGEPTQLAWADGILIDPAEARTGELEVLDGEGAFAIPGLIDCHVHLHGTDTLDELATHGVTTALDMSSPPPLVDAVRALAGRAGRTDIRSAMMALSSPDSAHAARMREIPAAREAWVADVGEVGAAVQRRVDQGADYIKVVIDLPGFDQRTVEAIVTEAHEHGLLTIAHASRLDALEMAHRAGVDVLTHVPLDRPIPKDLAAAIAASGAIAVPTLTMMKAIVERLATAGGPGPSYEPARASVAALRQAGVPILVGTDANRTPAAPASPTLGASIHDEVGLLVEAGLSAVEVLRGATSDAARRFGLADRGRLVPGLRADLVLLRGDPIVHPQATQDIHGVWVGGERVAAS